MFKNKERESLIYELNSVGKAKLTENLTLYSTNLNKAITHYLSFNETEVVNKEDLGALQRTIEELGDELRISSVMIDVIGDGLGINKEDLIMGLDRWLVQIGVKTNSLFHESEDIIDKLQNCANIYKNKYLSPYFIAPDKYQAIFLNGITMKKTPTLNHNVYLISSQIYRVTAKLVEDFLEQEEAQLKYHHYRELCILHLLLISEMQQPRKVIGW